jgi:APA family basic amino acid/polyamine antiporter
MMYYLLTNRPLESVLGLLIMLSGLLIYAIFRKQSGNGRAAASSGRE